VETIRDRAQNHRDRKCRETEDTRDGDFKIKEDTKQKLQILTSKGERQFSKCLL